MHKGRLQLSISRPLNRCVVLACLAFLCSVPAAAYPSFHDILPPPDSRAPVAAQVCIISSEFAGVVPNGGIGTFYSALAEALAGSGHNVTLLYTHGRVSYSSQHPDFAYWRRWYAAKGVELHPLETEFPLGNGHFGGTSWQVFAWLQQQQHFDVLHFSDWQGYGYFTTLAKHLGLDFPRTTICVMTHGPLRWARASNQQPFYSPDDLEADWLEQQTIRFADVLVSPSNYLLQWMRNSSWQPPDPARIYVQPYILPQAAKRSVAAAVSTAAAQRAAGAEVQEDSGKNDRDLGSVMVGAEKVPLRPVTELVFFGRLEVRKGLVLFCDAVDMLLEGHSGALPNGLRVSFLGSDRNTIHEIPSTEYVRRRSTAWGSRVTTALITDKDTVGALSYLLQPGRAAVLPSLAENAPLSILELIGAGIPFLASTAGGIPEEILPAYHERVLFAPVVEELAAKLMQVLQQGAVVPRAAFDMDQVEHEWISWHAAVAHDNRRPSPAGCHACSAAGNAAVRATAPAPASCSTAQHSGSSWKPAATAATNGGVEASKTPCVAAYSSAGCLKSQSMEALGSLAPSSSCYNSPWEDARPDPDTDCSPDPNARAGECIWADGGGVDDRLAAKHGLSMTVIVTASGSDADLRITLQSLLDQRKRATPAGKAGSACPTAACTCSDTAGAAGVEADDRPSSMTAAGSADRAADNVAGNLDFDVLLVSLRPSCPKGHTLGVAHSMAAAGLLEELRGSWLCHAGSSLAAARNVAAQHAHHTQHGRDASHWLAFLPDGAMLQPDALRLMSCTAQQLGSAVVTSPMEIYAGELPLDNTLAFAESLGPHQRRLQAHLGPALGLGAFRNCFGGPLLLIRHSAFRQLVAFNDSLADGYDFWQLLARAALAGIPHAIVPKPLLWTRHLPGIWWHPAYWAEAGAQAAIQPYRDAAVVSVSNVTNLNDASGDSCPVEALDGHEPVAEERAQAAILPCLGAEAASKHPQGVIDHDMPDALAALLRRASPVETAQGLGLRLGPSAARLPSQQVALRDALEVMREVQEYIDANGDSLDTSKGGSI